jgi:hypothetical protein
MFAKYYTSGSTRYYAGKTFFADIDIGFRHPFFNIEDELKALVPHDDGRPKVTRFVCSCRVLEHMDFNAFKQIYMTSPEGHCIGLYAAPYGKTH